MQTTTRARALALDRAGSSIAARIAMIATTTNSSMRVKGLCFPLWPIMIVLVVACTALPSGIADDGCP